MLMQVVARFATLHKRFATLHKGFAILHKGFAILHKIFWRKIHNGSKIQPESNQA